MAILIKRAAAVVISKSISDQFPEEINFSQNKNYYMNGYWFVFIPLHCAHIKRIFIMKDKILF